MTKQDDPSVKKTGAQEPSEDDLRAIIGFGSEDDTDKKKDKDPVVGDVKDEEKKEVPPKKDDEPVVEKKEGKQAIKDAEEKIPAPQKKYPEVTADDYVEQDGKIIEIKAQHIIDDIKDIVEKDMKIYLRIFNRKDGGEKAEVIAKALGFEEDATRTSSEVARDVINKYIAIADKVGVDEANEWASKNFPFQMTDTEALEFKESVKEEKKDNTKKPVLDGLNFSADDVRNEVDNYVSKNLWKRVDRNMSDEEVEKERAKFHKELSESTSLLEEMKNYRFDPSTGEAMSLEKSFSLAADKVFKKPDPVQTPKYEKGKPSRESDTQHSAEEVEEEKLRKILTI